MVNLMPGFFVGGLLWYAGYGYIVEGIWDPYKTMPRREYVMIWLIVLFSFFFSTSCNSLACAFAFSLMVRASICLLSGLMQAVGLGLALACLAFIWRYSSSPFVRSVHHPHHLLTGSARQKQSKISHLSLRHDDISIMHLQGYLFFGSVESVVSLVLPCVFVSAAFVL